MISIDELTINQVHDAYKFGEYSCADLVSAYLDQVAKNDQAGPRLNAITIVSLAAIEDAIALDDYFKENGTFIGPLHGVPVIVKDQCDTKGLETTYGNICCKHVPSEDATLVKKLRDAGAVILAKSTMPDFAASFNSCSSVSGETLNPYILTHETGGSSAGTGAAIAANYGLIGVGEDTGGSIRVPASFCNLVGLRPTVGLISRAGLSPLVKLQDTPGPMTRTVRDAALMLDVLAGYDAKDPFTATAVIAGPPRGGSYASNLSTEHLAKARLGVLNSVFGPDSDPECAAVNAVIRSTLAKFPSETQLIDISIPKLDYYLETCPIYSFRARYDIDNFLSSHPHLKNVSVQSIYDSKSFHPSLPLFAALGTSITSPFESLEYASRLEARDDFQRLVINIMHENNLDAIVFPSVRVPAPTVQDTVDVKYKGWFPTNTVIGSESRLPAISVPVGFTEEGLPVGLELLGGLYQEQRLLELAFGVEGLMGARRKPELLEG